MLKRAAEVTGSPQNIFALQTINWKPFGAKVFDEAKLKQLPILLYFFAPHSRYAKQMDSNVLGETDVERYVERNFVSSRVDLQDSPEWETTYLPFKRTQRPILSDVTLMVLTQDGKIVDSWESTAPLAPQTPEALIGFLARARAIYGEYLQTPSMHLPGQDDQLSDLQSLDRPTELFMPRFANYEARLGSYVNPKSQLMIFNDMARVAPSAWMYGLKSNAAKWSIPSLTATVKSSLHDWVDGGFFRLATDAHPLVVDCSKRTSTTAQMLDVLATANILNPDPLLDQSYIRAMKAIREDFTENGDWGVCRISDQTDDGRSPRASLTIKKVWGLHDYSIQEWLTTNMMAHTDNRMNLACISSDVADWDLGIKSLDKVQTTFVSKPQVAGLGRVDASMYALARLLSSSRLRGDQATMNWAGSRLDSLNRSIPFPQIPTFLFVDSRSNYIGGYLSVVDACLQDYLANGRYASLELGHAMLNNTIKKFWIEKQEYFSTGRPVEQGLQFGPDVPQIADQDSESQTAIALRLLKTYSRILLGSKDGQRYSEIGNRLLTRFSGLVDQGGLSVASFYLSALDYLDDQYAIAVGPDGSRLANELAKRVPTRLIFPTLVDVRPDFATKPQGIYVVSGANIEGPYSVDQAARSMRIGFATQ